MGMRKPEGGAVGRRVRKRRCRRQRQRRRRRLRSHYMLRPDLHHGRRLVNGARVQVGMAPYVKRPERRWYCTRRQEPDRRHQPRCRHFPLPHVAAATAAPTPTVKLPPLVPVRRLRLPLQQMLPVRSVLLSTLPIKPPLIEFNKNKKKWSGLYIHMYIYNEYVCTWR